MTDLDDLFSQLPVAMQQLVARGDLSLDDLLERVTGAHSDELCPRCAARVVAVRYTGLCRACHLSHLTEAANAAYAELVATQIYNVAKQRLKRKREELGVKAPNARAPKMSVDGDAIDNV